MCYFVYSQNLYLRLFYSLSTLVSEESSWLYEVVNKPEVTLDILFHFFYSSVEIVKSLYCLTKIIQLLDYIFLSTHCHF